MRSERKNANVTLQDVNEREKLAVEGGASAFLMGEVVARETGVGSLVGGGQTAAFPVSISNGRFTQSGTTLCEWHNCTVYISGC